MKIAGIFSFNSGQEFVDAKYPHLRKEVDIAIASVDASHHKTKESKEKTMKGKMLYDPKSLNKAFKHVLFQMGWASKKVLCEYSRNFYVGNFAPARLKRKTDAFREMDFLKERLGVEVQFGKYAFMVYNVCAKMTIFQKLGFIDGGIEIVPVKDFAEDMSTGVSYFEQFVWDLEKRGVANIDIPVLILGITE